MLAIVKIWSFGTAQQRGYNNRGFTETIGQAIDNSDPDPVSFAHKTKTTEIKTTDEITVATIILQSVRLISHNY